MTLLISILGTIIGTAIGLLIGVFRTAPKATNKALAIGQKCSVGLSISTSKFSVVRR